MLVISLAVVTAASTFILTDTLPHRKPCGSFIKISLIIQNLVDMIGHLSLCLAAETSDYHLVVVIATRQLTVRQIAITRIAIISAAGFNIYTRNLSHIAHKQDVCQIRMRVVVVLNVRLDSRCSGAGFAGCDHCCRAANLLLPRHKRRHSRHKCIMADNQKLSVVGNRGISRHRCGVVDISALINLVEFAVDAH